MKLARCDSVFVLSKVRLRLRLGMDQVYSKPTHRGGVPSRHPRARRAATRATHGKHTGAYMGAIARTHS